VVKIGTVFIFKSKTKQILLDYGYCYVLRGKKRHVGKATAIYAGYRKRYKFAKVNVVFVKEIFDKKELTRYLPFSGFDNVYSWWDSVYRSPRNYRPPFYLYKLVLIKNLERKPRWVIVLRD